MLASFVYLINRHETNNIHRHETNNIHRNETNNIHRHETNNIQNKSTFGNIFQCSFPQLKPTNINMHAVAKNEENINSRAKQVHKTKCLNL
jgi:cytochrome b involved in lipid metabolism